MDTTCVVRSRFELIFHYAAGLYCNRQRCKTTDRMTYTMYRYYSLAGLILSGQLRVVHDIFSCSSLFVFIAETDLVSHCGTAEPSVYLWTSAKRCTSRQTRFHWIKDSVGDNQKNDIDCKQISIPYWQYDYWMSGNPNDHGGTETCLAYDRGQGYFDHPCTKKLGCICQLSPGNRTTRMFVETISALV